MWFATSSAGPRKGTFSWPRILTLNRLWVAIHKTKRIKKSGTTVTM